MRCWTSFFFFSKKIFIDTTTILHTIRYTTRSFALEQISCTVKMRDISIYLNERRARAWPCCNLNHSSESHNWMCSRLQTSKMQLQAMSQWRKLSFAAFSNAHKFSVFSFFFFGWHEKVNRISLGSHPRHRIIALCQFYFQLSHTRYVCVRWIKGPVRFTFVCAM